MLVFLGGHGGIYHATYGLHVSCFFFVMTSYVSVSSKPDHPSSRAKPGQSFDGQIPHPWAKQRSKTPPTGL